MLSVLLWSHLSVCVTMCRKYNSHFNMWLNKDHSTNDDLFSILIRIKVTYTTLSRIACRLLMNFPGTQVARESWLLQASSTIEKYSVSLFLPASSYISQLYFNKPWPMRYTELPGHQSAELWKMIVSVYVKEAKQSCHIAYRELNEYSFSMW